MPNAPEVGAVLDGYRFDGGDPASPSSWTAVGPKPGTVMDGYRFKGGNPADPTSWTPFDPANEPGFFSNVGSLLKQGAESALTAARVAPDVVTQGNVADKAGIIASQLGRSSSRPPELEQVQEAFKDEGEAWKKAEGFTQSAAAVGSTILEVGKQLVTNPKGTAYLFAEQAANMVPSIVGMLGGAKLGGAVGSVVPGAGTVAGGVVGGLAGAFSGSAPIEIGSEFVGLVGQELVRRKAAPTEDNVRDLLSDPQWTAQAFKQATTKGVTTAGVDAAMTLGAGAVASAPRRAAMRAAREELGAAADATQIAARAEERLAQRTLGQQFRTGATAVGLETGGEGLSEAAGQKAAYGQVDLADVGLEMLGGAAGSAATVPAAARTFYGEVGGLIGRMRQSPDPVDRAVGDAMDTAGLANDPAGGTNPLNSRDGGVGAGGGVPPAGPVAPAGGAAGAGGAEVAPVTPVTPAGSGASLAPLSEDAANRALAGMETSAREDLAAQRRLGAPAQASPAPSAEVTDALQAATSQAGAQTSAEPADVLPGDVLNRQGQPFAAPETARMMLRRVEQPEQFQIAAVKGGYVLRPTPEGITEEAAAARMAATPEPASRTLGLAATRPFEPASKPPVPTPAPGPETPAPTAQTPLTTPITPTPAPGPVDAAKTSAQPTAAAPAVASPPVAEAPAPAATAVTPAAAAVTPAAVSEPEPAAITPVTPTPAAAQATSSTAPQASDLDNRGGNLPPLNSPRSNAPASQPQAATPLTVTVNDKTVTLTPEQTTRWNEAKTEFEAEKARIEAQYERAKEVPPPTNPDVGYISPQERRAKDLKSLGMRYSAQKREIAGVQTPKEQAQAAADAAKLRLGDRIVATIDGQEIRGTVRGTPFGRVAMQGDDGTARTVARNLVQKEGTQASVPEDLKPADAPSKADDPLGRVAVGVAQRLLDNEKIDATTLFADADREVGGTQAEGAYTPKDAYDALELGVNLFIKQRYRGLDKLPPGAAVASDHIRALKDLLKNLPTQTRRTAEQDEFQQFSTPPSLAYAAAWAANVRPNDVVLEPSAGLGGLAVWAKVAGARVIGNELAPRRAALLRQLGIDQVFTENGEQINNILPADVRPTVVIMNPPFSATAGRMQGARSNDVGYRHVEQALNRLESGGRLVAILGDGAAVDRLRARIFWDRIKKTYNIRADIGVSGKEYAKYGTTFSNRLIVIDKTGPQRGDVLKAEVDKVEDVPALLESIRDDRTNAPARSSSPDVPSAEVESVGAPAFDSGQVGTGRGRDRNSTDRPKRFRSQASGGDANGAGETAGQPSASVAEREPGRGAAEPVATPSSAESERSGRDDSGGDRRPDESLGLAQGEKPAAGSQVSVQAHAEERATDDELTDSVYESYRPARLNIPGAQPHRGKLVQSAAMAAVMPPVASYVPNLPSEVIASGKLSSAQLEAITYAGQAHAQILRNGERKGFFIGDGTGVGKGREISGIIMDNWRQGRKRAIWISKTPGLINDAKRDFGDIDGDPSLIFDFSKVKAGQKIERPDGVAFLSYATLRSAEKKPVNETSRKTKSRVDQIVEWVGEDFDGVIAFDEAHGMGNAIQVKGARGVKKPSQQALAGIELQRRLPKARVAYVSATGATEPINLAYATRLGLWGEGTPFANVQEFVGQIQAGGLAAMELVSRDMKALGLYVARSLSFDGVTYSRLEHDLSPVQTDIYNELARAWQTVLQNINEALEITGGDKDASAKSAAMSRFWGVQQRFFNQIITSMQMPAILDQLDKDLAAGNAAVLQLVNTNEAAQERALEKLDDDEALEDLDLTPRDQLLEYVRNGFPVQAFEAYTDEEGNERMRPVQDSSGNPVFDRAAVALRDQLLQNLQDIRVPDGPLEMLLNRFGPDRVAEVTGRKQRVVRVRDADGDKTVIEKRGRAVARADAESFMANKKQILVFSDAGGTGFSFHADRTKQNQRRRMHYLVQPGWRADAAVQGFGRSHRTNQASEPHYYLVTTNLAAQKRFISSIARRLDQLGALTRGQRQTGSQGLFSAKDNLESRYATEAVHELIIQLVRNRAPGFDGAVTLKQLGWGPEKFLDPKTGAVLTSNLPPVPQFLNRLLSLTTDMQNKVFDAFAGLMEARIEAAVRRGELDFGLETLRALKTTLAHEEVVRTGEAGDETSYVRLELEQPTILRPAPERRVEKWLRNKDSGKVWALLNMGTVTNDDGDVVTEYRIEGTGSARYVKAAEWARLAEKYDEIGEAEGRRIWEAENQAKPATYVENVHMLTGSLLPIWDRLGQGAIRVARAQVDGGRKILGRIINPKDIRDVLKRVGAKGEAVDPARALAGLVSGKQTVELVNGWRLERARVSGQWRIEIKDPGSYSGFSYATLQELKKYGAFSERIQWQERVFFPVGAAGESALAQLFAVRPPAAAIDKYAAGSQQAEQQDEGLEFSVGPALGFYSALARAVDGMKQQTGPAQAWKGAIRALVQKGVKPDEIERSGVLDWLDTRTGKVTREEIAAFLRDNGAQVSNTPRGWGTVEPSPQPIDKLPLDESSKATPEDIALLQQAVRTGKAFGFAGATLESAALPDGIRELGAYWGTDVFGFRPAQGTTRSPAGVYQTATGKTFIDATAGRPHLVLLGHELLHRLRAIDPDAYDALVDRLQAQVKVGKYRRFFDDMKERGYGVQERADRKAPEDVIQEEFYAETLADAFFEERFWTTLGTQQPTLLGKIVELARRLIEQAKAAFSGYRGEMRQYFDDFDAVLDILAETMAKYPAAKAALEQARTNYSVAPAMELSVGPSRILSNDAVRAITDRAGDVLLQTMGKSERTFGWLKNFRTQYDKAQDSPEFARVVNRAFDYETDKNRFANEAADLAPNVILQLKELRDLKRSPARPADVKAVAKPIFEGTLDNAGQYSNDVLRDRYGLNERQIGMYREFYAAVNESLDSLTKSTMVQLARDVDPDGPRVMAMTPDGAALYLGRLIREAMAQADADPGRVESLASAYNQIQVALERLNRLKEEGYAPLMRFGRFGVTITPEEGEREFHMFETETAARRFMVEQRAAMPDAQIGLRIIPQDTWKLFQGISPETLSLFADMSGVAQDALVQEYIQLAVSNRSALKRMLKRKGIAGYSEDVPRVLAAFVTSNSRKTAGNLHMGEMLEAATQVTGDAADEAANLVKYLQNPVDEAAKIRGLLFVHYIGGSVASALVNMTQPMTMTFPYLAQFGRQGVGMASRTAQAATRLTAAMRDAATGRNIEPRLAQALRRAEDEGVVSPQELHQLQSEASRNLGNSVWLRRGMFVWGSLFSLAEQFNRRATFIAAYRTAVAIGEANPFAFAAKAVIETQGNYSRANRPNWARGAIGATVFTFKQFSIAYIEFLRRLPAKERALALGVLVLAAGVQGLPGADDLSDLIDTIAQKMGYQWNTRAQIERWLGSFLARGFSTLPGVPVDVSARMGLGNLIPFTGALLEGPTAKQKLGEALEVIGPAGGMVRDFINKGDLPIMDAKAVKDVFKAIDMYTSGMYRDDQGRRVVDVDGFDAAMKAIGLQPATVATTQRQVGYVAQRIGQTEAVETRIASTWAQGIFERDPDLVRDAQEELRNWNVNNPESPIRINPQQIRQRLQAMRMTREQRMIRTAPRELRGGVAAELR